MENAAQISVVSGRGKETLNRSLTRKKFAEVLEDGDNELPDYYRPTLPRMCHRMLELREDIDAMTREVG